MRPHLLVAALFAGFVLADAAVAEQMAGSIADCDRLAAHPNDPNIGASHDLTKSTKIDGADFVR